MGLSVRWGGYVKFLIYLIVVVLINVAGETLFFRIDLTGSSAYSISEASKEVVGVLSEPLSIKVFFTKNLPAPHNNTEVYLRDLLSEYGVYANENFNYRFYDVSPEEGETSKEAKENQELAQSYGIYPVRIQAIEKDEVKFKKAYMGVVIIHGDVIERIPALTSTDGLEYRLTTIIQKLANKISALLALPEKIQVKLFLSSSLETVAPYMRLRNLSELPARIESIVAELNEKNYGKLQFEYLDPSKDESLEEGSTKYHLLSLKWPELSGGKIPAGKGVVGLVMEYGDKAETIPLIQVTRLPLVGTTYQLADLGKMGEILDEHVESLIEINEDLGYLNDHGTLKILAGLPPGGVRRPDTMSNFPEFAGKMYNFKNVNLKQEDIPDSLNCLLVAGAKESFTDYELFQIDQHLMRGKSLALFLDVFEESRSSSEGGSGITFTPLDTGLEKLLEHYGIRMKKAYVMDKSCYMQRIPTQEGGGQRPIYFAPLIKSEFINKDLKFMRNIKGLIAIKISPLELNTEQIAANNLQSHDLFASSDESWEMRGRIDLNPYLIFPPKSDDEMKSRPLAYLVEGEFPSYFAGKPIPARESPDTGTQEAEQTGPGDDKEKTAPTKATDAQIDIDLSKIEGEGEFLAKGKPSKILLIASSEMLKDNVLNKEGTNANAIFLMNLLDYLNNREETAVMRSKGERFNPLRDTGATTKTFVKYFNIAGLPALVILFGLAAWLHRHSRKKRIQAMFQ
jgi:ABC-type uncharacterized transport system involved in gliding motility auxiliary subunit